MQKSRFFTFWRRSPLEDFFATLPCLFKLQMCLWVVWDIAHWNLVIDYWDMPAAHLTGISPSGIFLGNLNPLHQKSPEFYLIIGLLSQVACCVNWSIINVCEFFRWGITSELVYNGFSHFRIKFRVFWCTHCTHPLKTIWHQRDPQKAHHLSDRVAWVMKHDCRSARLCCGLDEEVKKINEKIRKAATSPHWGQAAPKVIAMSFVTVCYLDTFISFCQFWFISVEGFSVSRPPENWPFQLKSHIAYRPTITLHCAIALLCDLNYIVNGNQSLPSNRLLTTFLTEFVDALTELNAVYKLSKNSSSSLPASKHHL